MNISPDKKPSPILIWAAAIVTVFSLGRMMFGSGETTSPLLTFMNLAALAGCVIFLVITFLRRNQ